MDDKLIDIAGLDHFKQSQDALNDEKYVSNALIGTIINEHLTSVYRYKGSVDSFDELPKDGNENGDVYDVAGGMNYAWNGTRWDELGDHMLEVDPVLSSTSTNPVQNKAIKAELDKKAGTSVATSSNNGLMSAEDKSSLDGINDDTTGINLLRGTRDFTQGIGSLTLGYSENGFRLSSGAGLRKDADGFTELHNESGTNSFTYSPQIRGIKPDTDYTLSFKVRHDSGSPQDSEMYLCRIFCYDKTATAVDRGFLKTQRLTSNTVGFTEDGVWKDIHTVFHTPDFDVSDENVFIGVLFYTSHNLNSHSFKMINFVEGNINNPIWSASPFDVAQEADVPELPVSIENGGTGATTAMAARYNLFKDTNELTSNPTDDAVFAMFYDEGKESNGSILRRKAPYVWNWIKSKIESIFFKDASTIYPLRFGYPSGSGSVYYGVFCKIKIPEPTQNLSIQFLASNFSNYGSRSNGVYIVEVSGRGSTADNIPEDCMKVTCLSEPVRYFNDIKFWHYLDSESYLNFGFTTTTFPAGAKFTTLGTSTSPDIAEIGKLYNSTKKPSDDLTEVKVVPPYLGDFVSTSDVDKMFNGTYTVSDTSKLVDDAAVSYAIDKIKEL